MTVGGISTALQAYQAALRRGEAIRPSTPSPVDAGVAAPRFDALLLTQLETAAQDLAKSEGRSVEALTGRGNLQQVVEAVSAAELGLQKVTAVRDRVIAAYQEIMRMPI
ncbi:MAG: flagellar hook-basal body complex protein FliE [Geminicoccaceae bacterium]